MRAEKWHVLCSRGFETVTNSLSSSRLLTQQVFAWHCMLLTLCVYVMSLISHCCELLPVRARVRGGHQHSPLQSVQHTLTFLCELSVHLCAHAPRKVHSYLTCSNARPRHRWAQTRFFSEDQKGEFQAWVAAVWCAVVKVESGKLTLKHFWLVRVSELQRN